MSLLGSIVSGAGDLFSAGVNLWAANRAEKDNARQRQLSIDQFNSQMDETLQRRVADGLKAGINPLAAIGASANVSPTIHTAGGSDTGGFISRAGEHLANLFRRKQENDIEYDNQAKELDLESKRLENRILRNRVAESDLNLSKGAAKEIPSEQPTRTGDKPLFSVVYDLKDRPRLVVNQDVLEGDSDNAGYSASLLPLITDGRISKTTGQINSDQVRMMLDDMYYNMTGRHIQNLNELYISPTEVVLALKNAKQQSGFKLFKPSTWF